MIHRGHRRVFNRTTAWICRLPCEFRAAGHTFTPVNFFSTDAFLGPLVAAAFKNRQTEVRCYSLNGRRYRLLSVDGRPLTRFPFMDFVEPMGDAQPSDEPVAWLPVASDGLTEVAAYRRLPDTLPAPTLLLTGFATVEAMWAHVDGLSSGALSQAKRNRKKLERDVGPIEFNMDDRRREVFDACLKWKSAQYRATGLVDMFADPVNCELFERMRDERTLKIASLSAGGTLIAVHIGMLSEGRFYSWIPSYDHTFGRYAPGRLLFHALLEDSVRSGHREFDFLIGDEPYKWGYATHARCVGEAGEAPLYVRAQRNVKKSVKATLKATGVWEPINSWRTKRRAG